MKTQAILDEDPEAKQRALDFLELYDSEWTERISCHAHASLHQKKFNQPQYVPLAEDVTLLNKHLDQQVKSLKNVESYNKYAEVCLAQVILFNRKRSGEAQRITLEQYETGLKKGQICNDSDIQKSLTKFEIFLCESHMRVEVEGKKGSKVPVLFTEEMKRTIDFLLKMRRQLHIQSDYLFIKENASHPIRGCDCLRKHAYMCGAKCPELLTSTKLRKHLAVMSQILGLSEGNQDILARFMGHDIRIHRQFYRLPENTVVEMAKVSKVLHLINSGDISSFKGKDFDEIQFDQTEPIADAGDSDNDADGEDSEDDEDDILVAHQKKKCRPIEVSEDDEETDEEDVEDDVVPVKKRRIESGKQYWNQEEKSAAFRQLGQFLQKCKNPGKRDCEEALKKEVSLNGRTWVQLKNFIRNRITKKLKKAPISVKHISTSGKNSATKQLA